MKVWISKYALTTGLYEVEVELSNTFPGMVYEKKNMVFYHGEGREWHRTKEGAVKRAEEMRIRKINSLKKQIKKIENMKFA